MKTLGLSNYIIHYLRSLKINERNEVYETLLLMVLNDEFLRSINELIEKNIKTIKRVDHLVNYEIHTSKKYEKAIDLVCKSKYFIDNFSKAEIERKRVIIEKVIIEITTQSVLQSYSHLIEKDVNVSVRSTEVTYPTIEHKLLEDSIVPKIQLIFDKETPLDDIVKYLKEILVLKNKPKKRKLSLGQSFRMLQIEDDIRNNKPKDYEYIEIAIANEMKSRYGEKLTMESVAKSLQRIRKIKKDINTIEDK